MVRCRDARAVAAASESAEEARIQVAVEFTLRVTLEPLMGLAYQHTSWQIGDQLLQRCKCHCKLLNRSILRALCCISQLVTRDRNYSLDLRPRLL